MNENERMTRQGVLIRALRRMLKPLVRLMIRLNITFPMIRDLLKQIYIEQATSLVQQDGEKPSFSRIFILTGIHRKDIKRLSESDQDVDQNSNRSLAAMVIARWFGLPRYLNKTGEPRALPFNGTDSEPGFDHLVSEVSKDVRPRALLDEWLRQGIVSERDEGIVINQSAFVPSDDFEQLGDYFGKHIHDHLASAIHNLLADGEPMFERSVFYPHLTARSIQLLKQQARDQGEMLLKNLNQQAIQLFEQDRDDPTATHRFRMGCYWYDEE